MKGLHGIIFSYEKENGLRELIENRVRGSVPFGGDYRIIDFILSSMVNAGITDVGVIMHGKCQSMLDHLGTGKSWDLSRKAGGLKLLPAFAYSESRGTVGPFRGKMEALGSVIGRTMWCCLTVTWWPICRCGTCWPLILPPARI